MGGIGCRVYNYPQRRQHRMPKRRDSSLLLVFLVLPFLPSARAKMIASFFSYSTMMGLAGQSATRWKSAMERELSLAADKMAQAIALQDAATEHTAASKALVEKSLAEQEEAASLENKAEILTAKGQADGAKAAMVEEQVTSLKAEGSATEARADTLFAQGVADETVAEEDMMLATKEASLAADDTATAETDEAVTAACQFVPVMDVICDAIGSVAAVGLETQSVRNAAMAAENFAAAAAAQGEADVATAKATELQAQVAEDGEEIGTLESEFDALKIQSREELREARADETAALEVSEQSTLDKALAEKDETQAVAEEESSSTAWEKSTQHGAAACGNAITMSVVSAFAGLFWMVRLARSAVLPFAMALHKALFSGIKNNTQSASSFRGNFGCQQSTIMDNMSHIWHHFGFFVVFIGLWSRTAGIAQLGQLSIKTMGGVLFGFSTSTAATQSLLVHAIPTAYAQSRLSGSPAAFLWACCHEFSRRMVVLCPLVLLEILLLWMNVGKMLFVPTVVQVSRSWCFWALLVTTLISHYRYTWLSFSSSGKAAAIGNHYGASEGVGHVCHQSTDALLHTASQPEQYVVDYGSSSTSTILAENNSRMECRDEKQLWVGSLGGGATSSPHHVLAEASNWLPIDDEPHNEPCIERTRWFHELVADDCKRIRLLLVFELLMATVMIALFRQSTPILVTLWPASKEILRASLSWDDHLHVLALVTGAVGMMLLLFCSCFS